MTGFLDAAVGCGAGGGVAIGVTSYVKVVSEDLADWAVGGREFIIGTSGISSLRIRALGTGV